MAKIKYVALLRAINVGGKNIIKMAELKACFETLGFSNVQTYIQSGNVIFSSEATDTLFLVLNIEKELSAQFNYESKIALLSQAELIKTMNSAPPGFGSMPENYRYDVFFLRPPLTSIDALKTIKLKDGVDQAFAGEGALFFARLISKASQSKLSKITSNPIYKELTIRNWNTSSKLLELICKPND